MEPKFPNSNILIGGLCFLAAICIASTTFLIYVDKPYTAISAIATAIVGGLLTLIAIFKN